MTFIKAPKNVLVAYDSNGTNCTSVEQLKDALVNTYAGISVKIITSSGIDFADVLADGTLINSQTKKNILPELLF